MWVERQEESARCYVTVDLATETDVARTTGVCIFALKTRNELAVRIYFPLRSAQRIPV